MDLDAFVTVHQAEWDRLDRLSRRRRLSGAEVDELVQLYQRAATHLSQVRSSTPDPVLTGRLSSTVARARGAIAGGHEPLIRELGRLVTVSFPAAVYRARWWAGACAAGSLGLALGLGIWVAVTPSAQASVGTPAQIRDLVNNQFAGYYRENAAGAFAAHVWTNNAWIAALCFVLGVTGVGVIWLLFQNALNLGVVGGLMAANHRTEEFFGLITPHGLLELTAVFVAAGSGLKLFWTWVEPGPRPRGQALAQEGRSMVTVAMGLVGVLLVSGCIEAFVTPSPLPTWARIGIGIIAWVAFLTYIGRFGRSAVLAGETGDLSRALAGDVRPTVG